MGAFKPMPKMETTEPSVILKLKKGGTVKKADGGALPIRNPGRVAGAMAPALAAQMAAKQGRAGLMRPASMSRPSSGMPVVASKNGGEVESKAVHAKEEREMASIKKELKSHEGKPASKAHKGLKAGGLLEGHKSTPVGKTGSVEQFRGGYKKGGKACMKGGGTVPEGVGMSLTPDTRAMAERARPAATTVSPARGSSAPTPAEMAEMRRQMAEQKQDMETEAGYNRSVGKKTGGVIKKYADGGHCKMEGGNVAGFKQKVKAGTW